MDKILQLNEFFVESGNQEKSHVLLHITEPSTPEEIDKGYFFAICEIDHAKHQHIMQIQSIIDEIEQKYYEYDGHGGKHPLEMILEKINQENFSLTKTEEHSLDCVVGIISESEVVFSYHGQPCILLFYKNKDGVYNKMILNDSDDKETESRQLFSQIVQGKISSNDFLFLSSPRVTDYFNHDRLQKLITSRTAKQSAEHLEHALGGLRDDCSYGGLIIHVTETPPEDLTEQRIRPARNSGSVRSLDHLYVTEQNTASTLAPSVINKFNRKIQSFVHQAPHLIDRIEGNDKKGEIKKGLLPTQIGNAHFHPHNSLYKPDNQGVNYRHLLASTMRICWQGAKYVGQVLLWVITLLWNITIVGAHFLSAIFFLATNIGGRRRAILAVLEQNWKIYKEHIKNLPTPTKILFSLSIILVVTFISGIWYINSKKTAAIAEQTFTDQLKTLKEKKDSAESYLIYGDEPKAANEIMEAKNILAVANCTAETHQSVCLEIQKQIDSLALRIKKEVKINPQLVYDWSNITVALTGLAKINNKIIAYSKENPDLYVYDLLTKSAKSITTGINTSGFTAKAVPKENDYAIFIYNKNKILQYDPADDTVKNMEVTYPTDNTDITGLVIYNRKLYTADTGNGQIYRHDNIKSGFSTGKIWIKDGSKISNPTDITIDGDVFVAENAGTISKFSAGKKEEFVIPIIDPPLTQINNLWTYTDLQYLYALDSVQKRVIILNKDGRLNKQLTADILLSPVAMAIEETDSTGYILDKNKLYKIGL